jgi:hypothetical protein
MNEEEILEALLSGAILTFSASGKIDILALDDLPPEVAQELVSFLPGQHGGDHTHGRYIVAGRRQ